MTIEFALVSALDIAERARVYPAAIAPDSLCIAVADPAIASASPDGHVIGTSPGVTTVTVSDATTGDRLIEFPLNVAPKQEAPPALRAEHPRIRFSSEELPAVRNRISAALRDPAAPFHADVAAFFELAEQFAAETTFVHEYNISGEVRRYELPTPIPQPDPLDQPVGFTDYPFWTMLSRQVERRLTTLTAAWLLTGERRFADKAKAQLLALTEWRKWHEYDKATNNLSLPHFTMAAAIAYDELFDLLDNAERKAVRTAILNLGLRPMGRWFDVELDHNIIVLMHAGSLMGYLAIGDESGQLGKYFHAPLRGLLWYLGQRETSAVIESHTYTSYAMGNILPVAAAVRRATGNSALFDSPYLKDELMDFFVYFRAGTSGYANLSDSRYHEAAPYGPALHLWNEFGDLRAAAILADQRDPNPGLVPYLTDSVPAGQDLTQLLPRSRRFDRFDWVALRSAWNDEATLLAFVSSPSGVGHNHFDQNHFILNIGGEWLITDPGYQNYTPGPENVFTNATFGHNALTVNGEGQTVRGNGRVIAVTHQDRFDHVVGDATAAYEGRLERWHRHVVFAVDGYTLLVDDVIPADPADRIDLHFHTLGHVTHQGRDLPLNSVVDEGDGFRFVGEAHAVGLRFDTGNSLAVRHVQFPGAERFGTYLTVTPPAQPRHAIVTLLDHDPDPAAPIITTIDRSGDQIAVSVNHAGATVIHTLHLGDAPAWSMQAAPASGQ